MGKPAKNLSLVRRIDNRATARPPAREDDAATADEAKDDQPRMSRARERAKDEKRAKQDEGRYFWTNLQGKLFIPRLFVDNGHTMNLATIFKILLSIRAASSFWSIILDCDEVYNYWEPLHLLIFGHGFQTWEYSPEYGIRSWAYIYVHYLFSLPFMPFAQTSKVLLFHCLRFGIALLSLLSDYCLYQSACKRLGNTTGSFFITISTFSIAMFNASCAFLPSSFGMTMNAFAMAFYLEERWFLSVLCTAIGALLGWPFTAVLGFPIVIEMFAIRFRTLATRFIVYALAAGLLVLFPMYLVDSFFYGKTVIAPLNIVLYNVFSKHGPNLYGVEDVSYYVKNLLLNWNIALGFAVLSLPVALYVYVRNSYAEDADGNIYTIKPEFSLRYWYRFLPFALLFLSTLLWIGIFFMQPHKEERFLFPIFPLIALLAAVTLDAMSHFVPHFRVLAGAIVLTFIVLSVSRGYALHRNFSASMETYKNFHDHFLLNQGRLDFSKMNNPIRLCVGKHWHTFPSSFFIPENVTGLNNDVRRVEMRFLRSEFRGILPKPFESGPIPDITRLIPTEMNDANREEPSRYVPLSSCDYVIDLDTGEYTDREPDITKQREFRTVFQKEYLLAARSHPLFRAFYVPFTAHRLVYGWYRLVKRVN